MRVCRSVCALAVSFLLFFCGCGRDAAVPDRAKPEEIRAVWISCFDLPGPEDMRSENVFRAAAKEMFGNIRTAGLNTAFFQVRPYSDAMYRSSLFPYSAYISGKEGVDPGFDALEIVCNCAKEAGISLHAWINPFRIGYASKLDEKSDLNSAKQILRDDDPDNDVRAVDVDGMLYYNPANQENQDLIVNGVRELLEKYPIDGIHIDDYFYPTTKTYIDQTEYDSYLASGGTATRGDWRRSQINTLVRRLFICTKTFGQKKIFSISPALNIEKNRAELYADVARWAAYDGYCDWLLPQVYVGFTHETHPFNETVAQWRSLTRSGKVRLIFGLAAYKCGTEDVYAGTGRNEWIENSDILFRQILRLREFGDSSGFALFSYSYLFGGKMSDNSISEMNSVISVL